MKKKLLFLTIGIMLTAIRFAGAQSCTPDPQYTQPGVYPDTLVGLPCAQTGVLYQTTITAVVPTDSLYNIGPPFGTVLVTIDSIKIIDNTGDGTAVNGLPPLFTYTCNPPSCAFPGGGNGCILLIGTPSLGDTGTYPLVVELKGYAKYMGNTLPPLDLDPVDQYSIKVVTDTNTCNVVGIGEISNFNIAIIRNTPNPFTDKTEITFTAAKAGIVKFKVYDMLGKLVYTENIKAKRDINTIEFFSKDLPAGVYMYSLHNDNLVVTKRMVVAEK